MKGVSKEATHALSSRMSVELADVAPRRSAAFVMRRVRVQFPSSAQRGGEEASHQAHNLETTGSIPVPASMSPSSRRPRTSVSLTENRGSNPRGDATEFCPRSSTERVPVYEASDGGSIPPGGAERWRAITCHLSILPLQHDGPCSTLRTCWLEVRILLGALLILW